MQGRVSHFTLQVPGRRCHGKYLDHCKDSKSSREHLSHSVTDIRDSRTQAWIGGVSSYLYSNMGSGFQEVSAKSPLVCWSPPYSQSTDEERQSIASTRGRRKHHSTVGGDLRLSGVGSGVEGCRAHLVVKQGGSSTRMLGCLWAAFITHERVWWNMLGAESHCTYLSAASAPARMESSAELAAKGEGRGSCFAKLKQSLVVTFYSRM